MGIDDFILERRLGAGAYGRVYQVTRRADGKRYALKRVNLEGLEQKDIAAALNEIRLLASFQHPRIVRFYETFIEQGTNLCVVMEYCGWQDLERKIARYKTRKEWVDERVIWVYIIQTLEGLQALHALKVLHRDIKPANILLDADGNAKVGDLNVSKFVTEGDEVQTVIGTLTYMAPEIWESKPYSFAADVYSLGCTFYELAALAPPFNGNSLFAMRRSVLKRQFKSQLPQGIYSEDLKGVIMGMLDPDPETRGTAESLLALPEVASRQELVRYRLPAELPPHTPPPMTQIDFEVSLEQLPLIIKSNLPGPTYPLQPHAYSSDGSSSQESSDRRGSLSGVPGGVVPPHGGARSRRQSIVPITLDPSALRYQRHSEKPMSPSREGTEILDVEGTPRQQHTHAHTHTHPDGGGGGGVGGSGGESGAVRRSSRQSKADASNTSSSVSQPPPLLSIQHTPPAHTPTHTHGHSDVSRLLRSPFTVEEDGDKGSQGDSFNGVTPKLDRNGTWIGPSGPGAGLGDDPNDPEDVLGSSDAFLRTPMSPSPANAPQMFSNAPQMFTSTGELKSGPWAVKTGSIRQLLSVAREQVTPKKDAPPTAAGTGTDAPDKAA